MKITIEKLVWAAPAVFVVHVMEEAPGFVTWMNDLLDNGISFELFVAVNITGFVVTILLALAIRSSADGGVVLVALAWFSFVMLGNAILHITATLYLRSYSPGVLTSILLYLPFYAWFVTLVARTTRFRTAAICAAIVSGAVPMLVHGYLIIFEGTTLFGV